MRGIARLPGYADLAASGKDLWKSCAQGVAEAAERQPLPPHLVQMRQRSASSGIMNGRASNEPGLWDCVRYTKGAALKLGAHAGSRAEALAKVALRLPAKEALAVARAIEDAGSRARALTKVALRLGAGQISELDRRQQRVGCRLEFFGLRRRVRLHG